MKKFLASVLAIMMTLSFVACGETQTSAPTTENEPVVEEEIVPVELPTEFEISTGVYKCGTDFASGAYTVSIEESDGMIWYSLFPNMEAYEVYKETDEYENSAFAYVSLMDKEIGYLEIDEGEILFADGLSKASVMPFEIEKGSLPDGIYKIGEHVSAGSYELKNTAEYGTTVAIFESTDRYLEWFNSGRREDATALPEFAMDRYHIFQSETVNVSVENDQVLMIDGMVDFEVF